MEGYRIEEALQAFGFDGEGVKAARYGSGHINDTFLVTEEGKKERFILQRINTNVFKDPVSLMKNVEGVTKFLRQEIEKNGGDVLRETLNLLPAKDGKCYFVDSDGKYWRVYLFIEDAATYDLVEKPEDFYESARAFGRFQLLLAQYPVEELSETIPDFHNTPVRFETFKKAIADDVCGRAAEVQEEIKFFLEREEDMGLAMKMFREGKLRQCVTHNDTKLNNIMIDDATRRAICVIDLDTIMPGFSIFDFGDSIRFGANTAAEDEKDLSKVTLSLELFDIYTKGFMEGCEGKITQAEKDLLANGAKIMTMECGMRFLTDYLQGDTYFKIHREGHNRDRARTQITLVKDMEAKWEQMLEIVRKRAAEIA